MDDPKNPEQKPEPEGLENNVEEPPRSGQDSVPVDGETVIHMPEGTELIERGSIQG